MTRDHRLRSMSVKVQRRPEFRFPVAKCSILSGAISQCVGHEYMSYMSDHEKQCLVDLIAELLTYSLGDVVSGSVVEIIQKQHIKVCTISILFTYTMY